MEPYIPISFLNDFIFCPRSIYFHQIYQGFDSQVYHTDIQVKGRMAHLSIDNKKYSTRKDILQGFPVFSSEYSLHGRIDTFDRRTGVLTERKRQIKKIYDGFVFQIYAQYYCLEEMGYQVNKLFIYSMNDNKKYFIPLPENNPEKEREFKNLLKKMHSFQLEDSFSPNKNKCKSCIYQNLCDCGLSVC